MDPRYPGNWDPGGLAASIRCYLHWSEQELQGQRMKRSAKWISIGIGGAFGDRGRRKSCAAVADQADPHARRISRRRANRRRRSPRERKIWCPSESARRGRQPPGGLRQHCRGAAVEGERGRPHAALFLERDRALAGTVHEARLRSAQGHRAGDRGGRRLPDIRRASVLACEDGAGIHRLRQNATGRAQLRLVRAPARARTSRRFFSRSARVSRRSTFPTRAPRPRSWT